VRDFGNWERRGPLSPLAQPERTGGRSRDGSRPEGTNDGRSDSFRNRHASPAWGPGEGREPREPREPRLDGSRPPRPERAPTAAEQDNQWRSHMRPDAPPKSESNSRAGSEAPSSPAGGAPATLAGGRPKLNLIKRTVSEQPAVTSPAAASSDSKASPFGAARPIDTAAREREIEEKRLAAIKEKKEADEKLKEERRLAKEAATKEAAEKAAAEEAAKEATEDAPEAAPQEAATETPEAAKAEDAADTATEAAAAPSPAAAAESGEQKVPIRTREPREPRGPRGDDFVKPPTRATESGNWRSASAEQRGGPRGGGARGGPRGGAAPRGARNDGGRPPRANGAAPAQGAPAATAAEPETPKTDEDGWTTVTLPVKGRRGGRPVA
jgi:translation initiation factor 4B